MGSLARLAANLQVGADGSGPALHVEQARAFFVFPVLFSGFDIETAAVVADGDGAGVFIGLQQHIYLGGARVFYNIIQRFLANAEKYQTAVGR
jgi:hypothetical protein